MRKATSLILAFLLFGTSFIAPPVAAADEQAETVATSTPDGAPVEPVASPEPPAVAPAPDIAATPELKTEPTQPQPATPDGAVANQSVVAPAAVEPSSAATAPAVISNPVTEAPVAPPVIPVIGHDIMISRIDFDANGTVEYLELYNASSNFVLVSDMTIRLTSVDATDTEIPCDIQAPAGYVGTKSSVGLANSVNTAQIARGAHEFSCGELSTAKLISVEMIRGGSVYERLYVEPVSAGHYVRQSMTNEKYLLGQFSNDFRTKTAKDTDNDLTEFYYPPETLPIKVLEFVPAVRDDCTVQDVALSSPGCRKYIKIKNISGAAVDVSQFVLRSGTAGSTTTAQYKSQLHGVLVPGEVRAIYETAQGKPLYLNSSNATAWFEDAQNVMSYDADVAVYPNADTVANRGRAWAYNPTSGQWGWATPNPLREEPIFTAGMGAVQATVKTTTLQPCKEGQYRSPETNRCRSLTTTASTLKPCKEGQYRSEETNRCRSIASAAAAVLKPCADDQFRNPATNRCKKIASAEDILQPCKTGYERNTETNRCRKIKAATAIAASYPVQPYTDNTMQGFWWGVGAVGLIAAGYAGWEWRHEAAKAAGVVRRRFFQKNRV